MTGEMKDLIEKVVTSDPVARKVARAQKLDTRLGALALESGNASASAAQSYTAVGNVGGIDDGNPPANPSSIVVLPGIASLEIRWTPPVRSDGVVLTRIRKTLGAAVQTKTVRQSAFTWVNITNYAPDTHLIEVQHEDAWGRVSAWVSAGSFSPLKASDYDIASVSAAKITAGTIAAQTITLGTGGTLSGGGGRFDDNGFSLANAFGGTNTMRPSSSSADWFTGPTGTGPSGSGTARYAGMAFFSYTTGNPRRGVFIGADGVQGAGEQRGEIVIRATDGETTAPATDLETAQIRLTAADMSGFYGQVDVKGTIKANSGINAYFLLKAYGDVDFTTATSIDFSGVRIQGGHSTSTFNLGSRWGYNAGALPTITFRRIGSFVYVSGRCQNSSGGINGNGLRIGWIDADYRPLVSNFLTIPRQTSSVYDGQCRIEVKSNGDIFLCASAANEISAGQDISFDGTVYSVL